MLLAHALQVVSPHPTLTPLATVPPLISPPAQKQFTLPIDVKAFLSQYGLNESLLWKFFLVEGTEVRPIYKLEVKKKTTTELRLALMMALETAIATGQFQVDIALLRTRCKEHNCYDDANFMKKIKSSANLFKTIADDQPLSLSPEGKSELADLLEQLKG